MIMIHQKICVIVQYGDLMKKTLEDLLVWMSNMEQSERFDITTTINDVKIIKKCIHFDEIKLV